MQPVLPTGIEVASSNDYPELINVWEASVRATHHFLTEQDIRIFKPLIENEYFDQVELYVLRSNETIAGFLGVSHDKIEMLFVHPLFQGKNIGKQLLLYAIRQLRKTKVDVNEQNENAVAFYRHFGFTIVGRSEKDGLGKPYPLLHLALK